MSERRGGRDAENEHGEGMPEGKADLSLISHLYALLQMRRPDLVHTLDMATATTAELMALVEEAIRPGVPVSRDPLAGVTFDVGRLERALNALEFEDHRRVMQRSRDGIQRMQWVPFLRPMTIEDILSWRIIDEQHVHAVTGDGRKLTLEV